MKLVEKSITIKELETMAKNGFGNMVKAVVDIEENILAVDADLHADLEAFLLQKGHKQDNLWGINLYHAEKANFVEFNSMINLRPSQDNFSRGVENKGIQKKILKVVNKLVKK